MHIYSKQYNKYSCLEQFFIGSVKHYYRNIYSKCFC